MQKEAQVDYFILSSEKTIEQLQDTHKLKDKWVVYDSSSKGSKKKILELPNVVYYTK